MFFFNFFIIKCIFLWYVFVLYFVIFWDLVKVLFLYVYDFLVFYIYMVWMGMSMGIKNICLVNKIEVLINNFLVVMILGV